MKTFSLLAASVIIAVMVVSCNAPEEEIKNYPSSFELTPKGDTVNIINHYGKQGIWVPSLSNKLKDTVYYRNDTIIG
ncbi:MAG: hypothetical protein V4677_16125 [Bacteroidota bacterium]